MKIPALAFIFTIFALTACSPQANNNMPSETTASASEQVASENSASEPIASLMIASDIVASTTASAVSDGINTESPMPVDLVAQFAWKTSQVIEKLKKSTPQQANRLYREFKDSITFYHENMPSESGLLVRINAQEQAVLDDFVSKEYWTYNEQIEQFTPTPSLQSKQQYLAQADLEYWEVGEGMAMVRPVADFYLKTFGSFVSPDVRRFLEIEARQNQQLIVADAAVAISFNELANNLRKWEEFIEQNPQSEMSKEAIDYYLGNQALLFFGLDNTPTYLDDGSRMYQASDDIGGNTFGADYQKMREQYTQQYPNSHTAKLLKKIEKMNKEQAKQAVTSFQQQQFGYDLIGSEK